MLLKVRNLVFLLFAFVFSLALQAQELNCTVSLNASRVNLTDNKRQVDDMQLALTEFMNTRQWTEDKFRPSERIICNMAITIKDMPRQNYFTATVFIQSARPVYGSSYQTVTFSFVDSEWEFEYAEGQPMDFNENAFTSNLTSLMAYYAYLILASDYDSFSKNGGKNFYTKAQQIAATAQQSGKPGWQTFEGPRNRAWLIDNLASPQFLPYREGMYSYYRLCLDQFADKERTVRKHAIEMLKNVEAVKSQKPISITIDNFIDAKSDEIMSIMQKGTPQERQQAYASLIKIDPAKKDKYEQLLK